MNVPISPSVVKDSFAGFSNFGWQSFSFRAYNTSFHAILALKVSGEKSVVLTGFSFYVTWHFSITAFSVLPLFWTPNLLTVSVVVSFFSALVCLVV
jgi:hypothetical protein